MKHAFQLVMRQACSAFYAHPWAWNEIGFGGPAYPRGYAVFASAHLDDTEPWEGKEAVDIFYDGKTELLLSAPFIPRVRTHGTGCTYAAAITAGLALGQSLPEAVVFGKKYITQAIARHDIVAGHVVLNHFRPRQ